VATVTFDGYDFGKKFVISEVARPFPEFRVSSTAITGADGEVLDDSTVGTRECSFVLAARSNSREDLHRLARELAGVMLAREAKKLVFTDEKSPRKDGTQLFRLASCALAMCSLHSTAV
jgi:predicted phage tail component-like protein